MALTKYKLGNLIYEVDRLNSDLKYGTEFVRGVSNTKAIMPTKADIDPSVIHKFYIIMPGEFVYNPRTTRMGEKVGLAYNDTDSPLLFTFNNIAFAIKDSAKRIILPTYLYIYFNRSEFDRYAIVNSWGSATELFTFEEMCDIDIELPDITVQQKFVDVYNSMLNNQRSYEQGLEDLKIVLEGYTDTLRHQYRLEPLGKYLELVETRNESLQYGIDAVKGVSIEKKFIDTKADMAGVNLRPYYVVYPNEFAYVTVTSRNGGKISLAINDSKDAYICSSSYVVFRSKNVDVLLPQYLMLYFSRAEFNRYARFHSWGSARETFDWEEMCTVEIPIPDIKVQKSIVGIYNSFITRREINEKLKAQIRAICPILIKGSLEEGIVQGG